MKFVTLTGSYNYSFVALSVLISMFASYAALDLASRVTAASGWTRSVWLLGGATAMGTGIWSMHYIGMLAFILPVPAMYDWPTVLLSLLAAILASAVALYVVSRQTMDALRALVGSILMGAGIASMHYVGMAAMRAPVMCRFDSFFITLSVLLAVLISFIALWITFHFRDAKTEVGKRKIAGAAVMGSAIPMMHYTGMAAVRFSPSAMPSDLSHAISISTLGTAGIAAVTFMVLGVALLTSWVDRRFAAQTLELHRSDERYRQLFERSLAGVYRATLDGRILDCNDAYSKILGYGSRKEQLSHADHILPLRSGSDTVEFLDALKQQKALSNFERSLRRKDDSPVWVLENATLLDDHETASRVIEGTSIDITERKRTEANLRRANSQLEAHQHEIEEELQLAARVQQTLVPASLTWGGISVETFYQPARTIGGDFGLVVPRSDCLSLLVCDVSGHGISSALIANRLYMEVMSQVERHAKFGPMMKHLNRFVLHHLGCSDFYFTLAAARVNRNGRRLEFAGAGHPPSMFVRPGQKPRLLESRSAVLGLLDNAVEGEVTIEVPLRPGDRVVMYTDGFTESSNLHEEMLGVDGLGQIVADTATLPLPTMKQEIVDRVAVWRGGPAADDMALVVIGIPDGPW